MTALTSQHEHELIHRVQQGDAGAFDYLVEQYSGRVYNLALRLVGNADDAQDMAQEAFLRVYDALPRFRGDAAFSTWLYRIVVNACHDELKRRRRRPLSLTELESDREGDVSFTDSLTTGEDAEDALLQRERSQVVQRAVTALPEPFRTVLILYDLQGFSYDEISVILRAQPGHRQITLEPGAQPVA